MRATIAISLFVAGLSTSAFGQAANFKCPPAGTTVEYSDTSVAKWLGAEASFCRTENKNRSGEVTTSNWYAPTASSRSDRSSAWVDQMKPSSLWPLTVGKKISARYTGENTLGTGTGVWDFTISVDGYEKVTTPAGTFDTFVVTNRQESLSSNFKSTWRQWYAPEPGVTVKFEYSNNQGTSSKGDAISIKR